MSTRRKKLRVAEKARRATFYRNGDYFDSGVKVAFKGLRPFPTMPHLLDYLSQKTRVPAKYLFDTQDGRQIKDLRHFEDGHSYIVSWDGKYQSLPYGSVPREKTSYLADALPARPDDLKIFRPVEDPVYGKKKRKKSKEKKQPLKDVSPTAGGRLLTVAARQSGQQARLLFNDRNPPSFEDMLKDFGRALGLEKARHMTTASGRPVRSISQLKNEFNDVDTFFLDEAPSIPITDKKLRVLSHKAKKLPSRSAVSNVSRNIRSSGKSKPIRLKWILGYNGSELLWLNDGELVYAVGAAIVLYHRERDKQRHYLDHTQDVCSLSAHPSGKMIASGQINSEYQNPSVHIWLVESLQNIAIINRITGSPISLAFSTHDFVLMSIEIGSEENCLSFWDWESNALLGRVQLKGNLSGGAFHPREPDLAVTFGEHHLAFWRRRKDGFLTRNDALAPGHTGRTIMSWSFIGDSGLAVGDSMGYVTLWAILPGDAFRIVREVQAHKDEVSSLKLLPNGTLISGGGKQLKAWDTHENLQLLKTVDLKKGKISALQLKEASDEILFVGTGNVILEGSLQTSFFPLVRGLDAVIIDVAVDFQVPSVITVDQNRTIARWSTDYLMWKKKLQVDCSCVGFHPGGLAVTAGGINGKLLVLHSDGGLLVATISIADVALKALSYTEDGDVLAVGCEDGNVYICESKNSGYLYKIMSVIKNDGPIMQIDWSREGDCLQTCYRKASFCEVALWNVEESKKLSSALSKNMDWPQHNCILSHNVLGIWKRIEGVFYFSCHRNSTRLAAGAQDGSIRIFPYPYRENEKSEYIEQKQGPDPIDAVCFLNSKTLISCSRTGLYVWSLKK